MTPRIVHVNTARGYRGGERQTELLIEGLLRRRVRQALVARRGGPLAARVRALGVEVREVSGGGPFAVARATRDAALVHTHEGRSVYGAYLRSVLSRTPYVITRRVNNLIGRHWFARRAYRGAAGIAAVAPQVADVVRAFDPSLPVSVIHSGSSGFIVDAARAAAIRAAFPGKLLIGHVGALDNGQKGQEYIIEVARSVAVSHPQLQFLLVGGGDDEAMLKMAAAGLTNITFVGFVDNVGDYLAAIDVFILPSNREGIGSILLDAMEQGLPVVASRVGGVPDVVHHRRNGLLIEPRRPDELRAAILELAGDAALRTAFGEHGHEFAKQFTADIMCRKYVELYESVLGPLGVATA